MKRCLAWVLAIGALFIFPTRVCGFVWRNGNGVILSGKTGERRIALTFDDGPHPVKTDAILDLLARYHIRATFFVIGSNAATYPDIIRREVAEGHEIGNHTYHHKALRHSTSTDIENELGMTEDLLLEIAGQKPSLFRPPEGACTDEIVSLARSLDYQVILWSIDTRDWAKTPATSIIQSVERDVTSDSIILFHDYTVSGAHTLEALEILIPHLLREGFTFCTVSELIAP